MALTVTIEERLNLGNKRGVIFKGVATTSTETLTASACGLGKFLSVQTSGGALTITFSGAARSTTGTVVGYTIGTSTATSGTFYGLAIGY